MLIYYKSTPLVLIYYNDTLYLLSEITWTIRQNWENKSFLPYVLPQIEAIVQLVVMVIMMKAVVGILTYI